ncbi:probable nadh-ubiquinone oxidoreductase 10.5 kDa subunit [Serendipita indica DSM 11827]|uniref:Probable nadh-ubiquinone oxidoreductase 10.5 kDa subunit n=1 Tax=Serendipita indica (strain DSM 11827) TaxID=1109443 RepID=G4TW77_SERID|nr:probable nadh-ubiquinone oxidoreductase 10.5 kDa subunit [Serendipita indica DSM 11827]
MSLNAVLSPALREIRLLFCQTGTASAGTRHFVLSAYPLIKKNNPDLPVLIREAQGTPARAFARFERGVERHVELEGLSAEQVEQKVTDLLTKPPS